MEKYEELVIRIHDKYGSFFCGFSDNESQIRFSRAKENAIIYDRDNDKIIDDITKIIQLSGGKLLPYGQAYEAAPNIAGEDKEE